MNYRSLVLADGVKDIRVARGERDPIKPRSGRFNTAQNEALLADSKKRGAEESHDRCFNFTKRKTKDQQ